MPRAIFAVGNPANWTSGRGPLFYSMNLSVRPTFGVSVSIVTFHPDAKLLEVTLATLGDAIQALQAARPASADGRPAKIWLVDNGGTEVPASTAEQLARQGIEFAFLSGHGNVGYGRGHNLAIAQADSEFHLILNPDVKLQRDALIAAVDFMAPRADVGLLAPHVSDESGNQQYLCRRFPKVVDLALRGFAPSFLRRLFRGRLEAYEMRAAYAGEAVIWDPAIVSGCFMFCRSRDLQALGGFDPRYFLYFEDYDLSLRMAKIARLVHCPAVRIVHYGGGAARKGHLHVRLFAASAVRFFNRFGWRWL